MTHTTDLTSRASYRIDATTEEKHPDSLTLDTPGRPGRIADVERGWPSEERAEVANRLHAVLSSEPSFLSGRRCERAPTDEVVTYPIPKLKAPDTGDPDSSSERRRELTPTNVDELRMKMTRLRTSTGPVDREELYPRHNAIIAAWINEATTCMEALYKQGTGSRTGKRPPDDIRLYQEDMPEWARGVVWDCRNPKNCRPVTRSTELDMPPGPRVEAKRMRRGAIALGWQDTDILDQLDTGLEARSGCALETVLAFHHKGLINEFEPARKIVERDIDMQWVSQPHEGLPFIPCRLTPRNVVSQSKWKVSTKEDGSAELNEKGDVAIREVPKHRVSTDSSWGPLDGDSPNDGCKREDVCTGLPTIRILAESAAIINEAGAHLSAEAFAIDFKDAYRHCAVQRADWWEQCFLWRGGVCIEYRGVFGAKWMPNRFQRVARLALAIAQLECESFDAKNPIPKTTLSPAWQKRPTSEQRPAFSMIYIDDTTGSATDDMVAAPDKTIIAEPVKGGPKKVKDIGIETSGVVKAGGTPSQGCEPGFEKMTRACAHAKIYIFVYTWLKLPVSPGKCSCGNKVEVLGAVVDCVKSKIRPPAAKAYGICKELQALQSITKSGDSAQPPTTQDPRVGQKRMRVSHGITRSPEKILEKVVGRLISLAVAIPECATSLADLMRAEGELLRIRRIVVSAGRRPPGLETLMRESGSKANRLIQEAGTWFRNALRDCGRFSAMPAASRKVFPTPDGETCVMWASDASGVATEGFGAWTVVSPAIAKWISEQSKKQTGTYPQSFGSWDCPPTDSETPKHIFILVADVWPPWAQEAGELMMSSNTAEAIGRLAVAMLMQGAPGVTHVVTAGDSMVVRGAAEKARSPARAMDVAIKETATRLQGMQSIAAQLPREYNQRADDLSKRLAPQVAQALAKGGDCGVIVPIPTGLEAVIRRAVAQTRKVAEENKMRNG